MARCCCVLKEAFLPVVKSLNDPIPPYKKGVNKYLDHLVEGLRCREEQVPDSPFCERCMENNHDASNIYTVLKVLA